MAHEDRGWACPQAGQKRRSQPGGRNMTKPTQLSRPSTNAFVFSSNVDGVDARPDWTSAFSGGSPQAHLAKAQRVQKHHGQGGQMWVLKNTWKCCKSWGAQQTSQEKPRSHRHHVVRCGIAFLAFQKRLIIDDHWIIDVFCGCYELMNNYDKWTTWTHHSEADNFRIVSLKGEAERLLRAVLEECQNDPGTSAPWTASKSVEAKGALQYPKRFVVSEIPASFSTLSGTLSDLSVFEEDIHPKVQGHVRVQAAQQTLQEALCMWTQKRRRSWWHRGQSCLKAGELVGDLSWELTPAQKVGVHGSPKTTLRDRWILEDTCGWAQGWVKPGKYGQSFEAWSKMVQDGPRWSKMTRDCSEHDRRCPACCGCSYKLFGYINGYIIYIYIYTIIWCISADKYLLARLRHILFEFFEDDVAFALSVGQLSDLVGWLSLLL